MTEKDKPQNLWKVLKNLGCLSKAKSSPGSSIILSIDGKEFNKKENIANQFTSVAHKLVEKRSSSPRWYEPEHIQDFYVMIGVTPNSFSFNPLSVVIIGYVKGT